MKLVLHRKYYKPTYTIGSLFIDGKYFCDTLEDTVRDGEKIPGKTAIPAGTYKVFMEYSPRFGRELPTLKDVPGFTHILIHPGNTVDDTDGCILVGRNRARGQVLDSKATFAALFAMMAEAVDRGESISLTVC